MVNIESTLNAKDLAESELKTYINELVASGEFDAASSLLNTFHLTAKFASHFFEKQSQQKEEEIHQNSLKDHSDEIEILKSNVQAHDSILSDTGKPLDDINSLPTYNGHAEVEKDGVHSFIQNAAIPPSSTPSANPNQNLVQNFNEIPPSAQWGAPPTAATTVSAFAPPPQSHILTSPANAGPPTAPPTSTPSAFLSASTPTPNSYGPPPTATSQWGAPPSAVPLNSPASAFAPPSNNSGFPPLSSVPIGAPPQSIGGPPPQMGMPPQQTVATATPLVSAPPQSMGGPPPSYGAPPQSIAAPPMSMGAPLQSMGAPPVSTPQGYWGAPPPQNGYNSIAPPPVNPQVVGLGHNPFARRGPTATPPPPTSYMNPPAQY